MLFEPRHIFLPCDGVFRRLAGCVAALMLTLQLLLPGIGQAQTTGSWIEICSEFGVIEIEVPAEDSNSQNEDCPDCEICLMCAAQNTQMRNNPAPASTLVLTRGPTGQLRPVEAASNPAQFWHDGRGPPRLNTNNMKRACGASMTTTQFKGEAS
ncbi:hypothetical protein [Pseudophaeobacter sp.]|uniref:hypothetical protein n=1 Tax=Pseudophaeobacter sp. TaxID=1971739 RepID=UPI004058589D